MNSKKRPPPAWWMEDQDAIFRKYRTVSRFNFVSSLDRTWEFMQSLEAASNRHALLECLERFCLHHGVNRSGWCILKTPDSLVTPDHVFAFNGDSIVDSYLNEGIINIDVMHHLTRQSINPITWGLPHQVPTSHPEERHLRWFYDQVGCGCGIMFPIHGPGFTMVGGFNFSDSASDFARRIPNFTSQAYLFCAAFQHTAIRLFGRTASDQIMRNEPLTNRETECIRWAAAGKTAWEISCILSISERTVVAHTENAKRKLDAKTLPHAVAMAISYGLIRM